MRLRILTWHVHGAYLDYLAHVGHEIVVPVKEGRPPRYGGRSPGRRWPPSLVEVPAEEAHQLDLDCVLFQAPENYLEDQFEILSEGQRRLPRIYLEHDPPGTDRAHYSFSGRHPAADDPDLLLVHVTHFNDLMWDAGRTSTRVIEHGVPDPGHLYRGELERGITVVNDLVRRGRRLGRDVFERARSQVPLDLVGMGSEEAGGLGEVPQAELADLEAAYRFFFHPIRYTSLGLAACEAMMIGMPVVTLATTEMPAVIIDGEDGFLGTDVGRLIEVMRELLEDRDRALRVGRAARSTALERFHLDRFVRDWEALLEEVAGRRLETAPSVPPGRGRPPRVDVLIPTRDRPAALAVTLAGLAAQTHPELSVLVADQGDRAATESGEVLAVMRVLELEGIRVRVLRNLPRRGMAAQRQFLLERSEAPYVLYLDDDVIMESDLIDRLVRVITAEGCGFVGSGLIGPSYAGEERPEEQGVELWEGPVRPEEIRPGSREWQRHRVHNAANLLHLQRRLGIDKERQRLYKVSWIGGCVLYDAAALRKAGGFTFHERLPPEHAGEDVVAQNRVMARFGGCGILPSGAFHQELPTKVPDRSVDAPHVLL